MSDDTALATLEQRVRDLIATQLRVITVTATAHLDTVIRANPAASGAEISADAAVYTATTAALDAARTATQATVRAGWRAAYSLGVASAAAQVDDLGRDATTPTDDESYLSALLGDITAAFSGARLDITDAVRTAHDGAATPDGRVTATGDAVDRAVRRLGVRVTAAAVMAVHRGFTDAQTAVFTDLADSAPWMRLTKRWEVRSTNPCPACAALDGTQVGLDETFDATATDDGSTPPRVYRDLHGPPRHPNCRCRIVLEPSVATAKLRAQTTRAAPGAPVHLSATQVRLMPTPAYTALNRFLSAALTRLQALLKEIDGGG